MLSACTGLHPYADTPSTQVRQEVDMYSTSSYGSSSSGGLMSLVLMGVNLSRNTGAFNSSQVTDEFEMIRENILANPSLWFSYLPR